MRREPYGIPKKPDRIFSYYYRQILPVFVVFLGGTIYNTALAFGPICQGHVIDELLDENGRKGIGSAILAYVAVVLLIQVSRFWKRFAVRLFANRTANSLRWKVYRNLLAMNPLDGHSETAGVMMTKVVSDVDACAEGMRKFVTELFDTGLMMLSFFIVMLKYDGKLSLLVCILIPIAFLIAERMKKMVYRFSVQYREQFAEVSRKSLENAEHGLLYRMNGMTEKREREYEEQLALLEKKAVRATVLENTTQSFYQAVVMLTAVFIILYGSDLVGQGIFSIGDFTAYLSVFASFAMRTSKAGKMFQTFQKASVSWKRILPYLREEAKNAEKEKESGKKGEGVKAVKRRNEAQGKATEAVKRSNEEQAKKTVTASISSTELKVTGLSAGFGENSVINEIRFTLREGEIMFITGPVACGKSTLGLTMAGFLRYQGSILINGRELSSFTGKELSENVSYMGQDYELLSDSIYENITLGDEGDIHVVLKDVCLDVDLEEMPEGQNTQIGSRGVKLSGGQQARLALARTLYHKRRILILDDPVSSVDMKTAEQIVSNLRENYSNCIILFITHRWELIRENDLVLKME